MWKWKDKFMKQNLFKPSKLHRNGNLPSMDGGYETNFPHSIIFSIFHHCQNTGWCTKYHVHIWQVSLQLSNVMPVIYVSESKELRGILAQ